LQTQTITIQGKPFNAPQPYAEGHTLTAVEASVLNQTYAENLRNNFAGKVKKNAEDREKDPSIPEYGSQEDFDAYAGSYSFNLRGTGGAKSDPVMSEARAMAKKAFFDAIRKRGGKPSELSTEQVNEAVTKLVSEKPIFLEKAKAIVATRTEALDLGI
jgi:hypothetical protein